MKRFLLALIFVIEFVVAAVLYFTFPQVMEPQYSIEPEINPTQSPTEQPAVLPQIALQRESQQESVSGNSDLSIEGQGGPSIEATLSFFSALPAQISPDEYQLTDELTHLGRVLYYDPRLSINSAISCNTCHLLDQYGIDHQPLSVGHSGIPVKRNSPTVYNSALHRSQFWDGRSPTVEEQAKEPILSDAEMGMLTPETVEERFRAINGYQQLFQSAFPNSAEPITFDNLVMAIGAFERKLVTPSRFDLFLQGDRSQLTEEEIVGLKTFVQTGCTNCHLGPGVGGHLFKKLGQVEPYLTDDYGRYTVTRSESDRYVFKVPSLLNIAKTAPYLHDGSIRTLPEMVKLMARYQLGKSLTEDEIKSIVIFLESLTGELPMEYIARPVLPQG